MNGTPNARIIRALTEDNCIRLAAVDASPLWDGVRRGHPHLLPGACARLTEVLAAALLLQSRSVFAERLQILLRGAGRARAIVGDAWPDGRVRGMLDEQEGPGGTAWIEAPGLFQVMRSGLRGEPSIGHLPLVEGGVAAQVEHYLQQSEQIQASVTLWCELDTGHAGGLLVEPLPDCPPERLARLVEALEGLEVVPAWERDPEFLLRWVNQGGGATVLSTTEVAYRCRCSRESLMEVLATFSAERRAEVFPEGSESAQVCCDYCGATYDIARTELPGAAHGA